MSRGGSAKIVGGSYSCPINATTMALGAVLPYLLFEAMNDLAINPHTHDSLMRSTADFRSDNPDLLKRWEPYAEWVNHRLVEGVQPFGKSTAEAIGPALTAYDSGGTAYTGVNLASQEYLSLASHPDVLRAVTEAVTKYGVHSAGSAALQGNTAESLALEQELAAFLGMADCTVFSTGWGAGFGIVKTLARPTDHIVLDVLAHACLQEGARAASPNIHHFPHCSTKSVERRVRRIRAANPNAGILVVTETLFSMDSDTPDIRGVQEACHRYGATLVVDVAHDLGAIGAGGRGVLGAQDMWGKADVVMGSFSKTFASNGGFVACNNPALKQALRYNCGPLTFTNAITPMAAAVVRACIRIITGSEGEERRERLMRNILHLRGALEDAEFEVLGNPSAIVPVVLGDSALSRLITKHCLRLGGIVNLVEYPAVSRNTSRWRLQVMADHTKEQIDAFVDAACKARKLGRAEWAQLESAGMSPGL